MERGKVHLPNLEPFTCLENVFQHIIDTGSFRSADKRTVRTRGTLLPSGQALCLPRPPAWASSCPSTCLVPLVNRIMFCGGVSDAELPSQSLQAINLLPEP